MSAFKAQLHALIDALRRLKAGYEAEDRFSKMRIWVIGAVGADVVLTLLFVVLASGPSLDVRAWYEEGFPSNLIVVQNRGEVLRDVELVVDGKYRARMPSLAPGPTGLEIDREFRDALDFPPAGTYKPTQLEIRAGGSEVELELRREKR